MNKRNALIGLSLLAATVLGFAAGQWVGVQQGVQLTAAGDIEQRLAVVGFAQGLVNSMADGATDQAHAIANLWIDAELVALDPLYANLAPAQRELYRRIALRVYRYRDQFGRAPNESPQARAILNDFADEERRRREARAPTDD